MPELLITSSFDSVEEGQVFSQSLPRHVTIWQYFQLPDSRTDEFINEAGAVIEGFPPLDIIALPGELDKFGPHNDVAVRRIRSLGTEATLLALHTALGGVIERHGGAIRNPEWANEGYNPHVTYVDGRALNEGEQATLTTVELIEKSSPSKDKIVRKLWHLEEANES